MPPSPQALLDYSLGTLGSFIGSTKEHTLSFKNFGPLVEDREQFQP